MSDLSLLERALRKLGPEAVFKKLSPAQRSALAYEWRLWARPKQNTPAGNWRHWFIQAGRGWGKTKTAAEWIRTEVGDANRRGEKLRIALVAPTPEAARDVMIEGRSGLQAVFPPYETPIYEPAKKRVRFAGGSVAKIFSAYEPGALRGPEHHRYWAEEIAAWKGERGIEAWTNLMLGLRVGTNPRGVVTSTPKPVKLVRDLRKTAGVHVSRGSTYENKANLSAAFLEEIVKRYEGTALGAQELLGELLEEVPGALWQRSRVEALRTSARARDFFVRVVIAVDPAVSNEEDSDETGIVAVGRGRDDHLYVLGDYSMRGTPNEWAEKVWLAYLIHEADRVVVEVNQGGDLVSSVLRTVDKALPITQVRASIGKRARAEPIAALYEQGRAHHIGMFEQLEDQMCSFTQDYEGSPDRVDALVWGATALMLKKAAILT